MQATKSFSPNLLAKHQVKKQSLSLFYGPYLASYLIVAQLFGYSAFMSFGFYHGLLDRILGTEQSYLAILTTGSIALMIFLGLDALAGYYLKKRQQKNRQASKDLVLFRSLWMVVGLLLVLDVYANWQGRGVVAETTTQQMESKEDSMYLAIQMQIDTTQANLDSLLVGSVGGYGWFERQNGEKRFRLNWSGKEYQRSLREEIQVLRNQQMLFSSSEIEKGDLYAQAYQEEVSVKKQAHGFLVFLAYPLSFLLCIFQRYYRMKQ